jgi:hypothetical protein
MARSHWHPSACRNIEKPGDHSGRVSITGLCPQCGKAAMDENVDQMEARKGPNWTKWRRSMVLCAHPELVDVLDGNP